MERLLAKHPDGIDAFVEKGSGTERHLSIEEIATATNSPVLNQAREYGIV